MGGHTGLDHEPRRQTLARFGQRSLRVGPTGKRLVAQMPEPLLPGALVAVRLPLEGGARPLLALACADHDPALGALRQVGLLSAPPVPRPVGAALPRRWRLQQGI